MARRHATVMAVSLRKRDSESARDSKLESKGVASHKDSTWQGQPESCNILKVAYCQLLRLTVFLTSMRTMPRAC